MAYTTIDNPELYFQTKLYTGDGSSRSITLDGSEDMQPDWVWIKARSQAYNHAVFDVVRGATKLIRANQTTAEETHSTTLTAFADVQHTSVSALTSADVLTYETTGTPGYFCFNILTSAPVIDVDNEQPAFISGKKTFLLGLISFAVSAIKWTPHIIILSAEVFEASTARAKESAAISATPW